MLLDKIQLGTVAFTSTDEERRSIAQLHVHPDGTVEATNGHVAVRVTRTPTSEIEKDFPSIISEETQQPTKPISIMRDVALSLLKQLKAVASRAKHLPVLANVQALRVDNDTTTAYATTDLTAPTVSRIKDEDTGTFPNFNQIIPKHKNADFAISFDPRYLIEICKYAIAFDLYKPQITMEFCEADSPALFRWSDPDHKAVAVLMPMRFDAIDKRRTRKEMRSLLESFRDAWADIDGSPETAIDPEKAVAGIRRFYGAARALVGPPQPPTTES